MLPPDVARLVPAATAPIYATAALAQAIIGSARCCATMLP